MTPLRIATVICLLLTLAAGLASAQNQPTATQAPHIVSDPGESAGTASGRPRDIAYWRTRIDAADEQIIKLLNERAGYVSQLIPLKAQAQRGVRDPSRERAVLEKLKALNGGPLPDESVARIYEAIMAEMRLPQEQRR